MQSQLGRSTEPWGQGQQGPRVGWQESGVGAGRGLWSQARMHQQGGGEPAQLHRATASWAPRSCRLTLGPTGPLPCAHSLLLLLTCSCHFPTFLLAHWLLLAASPDPLMAMRTAHWMKQIKIRATVLNRKTCGFSGCESEMKVTFVDLVMSYEILTTMILKIRKLTLSQECQMYGLQAKSGLWSYSISLLPHATATTMCPGHATARATTLAQGMW